MRITLKQLLIFVEVAKNKSVSIAAEKCFVSQPAASKTLALLEEHLNTSLFKRTVSKQMELTNDGHIIFTKANNIINQTNEIEAFEIDEKQISGTITVGASTTIANYVLPKLIPLFQKEYPNININIKSGSTEEITKDVEHFLCEIAFTEGKSLSNHINYILWRKDYLKIICSKDNPLASKGSITIDEALKQPWAMWTKGFGARNIHIDDFDKLSNNTKTWLMGGDKISDTSFNFVNVDFGEESRLAKGEGIMNIVITLDNPEAIKNYVANSLALGCLSETVVNDNLDNIAVIEIKNSSQTKDFFILMNKEKYHSKVVLIFHDWITQHSHIDNLKD